MTARHHIAVLFLTTAALFAAPGAALAATAEITGEPRVGGTLTCDVVEETVAYTDESFRWTTAGGKQIGDEQDLDVTIEYAGTTLTCTIDTSDGAAKADKVIDDAMPVFTDARAKVDITRGTGRYVCNPSREKPVLGGNISISYAWYLDGAPLAGQTAAALAANAFYGKGQLHCTYTASNAAGATTLTAPAEAGSSEDPKGASNPTITGEAKVGATLTCTGGSFTRPGWTLAYDWTAGSTSTVLGTGPTLVVPASALGGAVRCRLHAKAPGIDETIKSEDLKIPAPAQLTLVKKQPKVTLHQALALGVTTSTVLSTPGCTRASQLTIPAKLAKQLKLLPKKHKGSAPVVISAASANVTGTGTTPVSVKLSGLAKKAFAKLAKVTVVHAVTATCSGATPTTITRKVVLVKFKPVKPRK